MDASHAGSHAEGDADGVRPSSPPLPVAVIGLGAMGSAIAGRLIDGGHIVRGWDTDADARTRFGQAGGILAEPATLADAEVVISMVFDDAGLREVVEGEQGLLATLEPGAIHVAMASISPQVSRELSDAHRRHGQDYLAAPVFGRPEAVDAGTLRVNCSGAETTFQRVRPILASLGDAQWVGPDPEQALLVKLIGNSMIFGAVETLHEMLRFLRAGGVDGRRAKELLVDTLFSGQIYSEYAERLLADPDSGHVSAMSRKDRAHALEAAERLGVRLPLIEFLHREDLP